MSDKNPGGSEVATVVKASLSDAAKQLQAEGKAIVDEWRKFGKSLEGPWPAFYEQQVEDDGLPAQLKAASKAITGNDLATAKATLDKCRSMLAAITSNITKLVKASEKWERIVSSNVLTPDYVAELEGASQRLEAINEACKKAYFDASRTLSERAKTPGLRAALKKEIEDAASQLPELRKAVDRAYADAKKAYAGELLDTLTADASVTGSYQWFEDKKAALDTLATKGVPAPKVAEPVDPAKQAELDWMAVRADVNKKYKEFKTGAADATVTLPEWHRLRGPYMEPGLMTAAVDTTYFVLSEQHTIGGLTFTVSDSHTTGTSLKTPIPTVFRRAAAPDARSFIYHRPKTT